ncbi:NAD(P)-dependent oxidoreductase [Pseudomonas sp. H3_H05]
MRKLLVTGDFDIDKAVFPDSIELIHIRRPIDERQILEVLPDVHDYILGGPEYLSAELIEAATRLENIVVMGTGTSSFVDVQCVTDKGIKLANTPNLNVQAVAEFTLAMIVLCSARVFESAEGVKAGNAWIQTPRRSLLNLKVGFVGMGSIAGEVAYQLHMRGSENMCYWSRNRKESLEKSLGLQYTSLGDLVNTVDVLCIHLSGCAETFNLIDESVLARASTELMILNLSNPKIICPRALKTYLNRNTDAFCFIDGYYSEWVDNKGQHDDPYGLLSLPAKKLVVTSHLAAQEKVTVKNIFLQAVKTLHGVSGR